MPLTTANPRVTVQVVAWNSLTHLPSSLGALGEQTLQPLKVLVIDNASADRTVAWLEEHFPQYHLLRNTRNTGFCHAQNQGFRITRTPYVLVLNPDVVISPDWIQRGVDFLDAHPAYSTFGGKTLRYSYSAEELKSIVVSDIIDSTGLEVFRSRHSLDRGSGQVDRGQWDTPGDVFGLSGACVLYRMTALQTIRWQDEFFDEDFFAYKDDVDSAWRLQRMGWRSWYDPRAVAYHHRAIRGRAVQGNVAIAQTHRRRQRWITELSYRNHLAMLIKNETARTFWRDALWILWYEGRKLVFIVFTQPASLRGWWWVIRKFSRLRLKHRAIIETQRVSGETVRQLYFV